MKNNKRTLESLIKNADIQKYSPFSISLKNKRIQSNLKKLFKDYNIIHLDLIKIIIPDDYVYVVLSQSLHINDDEKFENLIKDLQLLGKPIKNLNVMQHSMFYSFTFKYDDKLISSLTTINKFNL